MYDNRASSLPTASTTTTHSPATVNQASHPEKTGKSSETDLLKGIDIDKFMALLARCWQEIEPGEGRTLFLLVGRTGAGKSTVLNYLMGSPLEFRQEGIQKIADVKIGHTVYTKIGHNLQFSETLYPKAVPMKILPDCAYVDLPGLRGLEDLEEKLCANVAFPLALQFAKKIGSILAVIDCKDLAKKKSKSFIDLLTILGRLPQSEQVPPIIFIFNKASKKHTLKDILFTINRTKTELIKKNEKNNKVLNSINEALATRLSEQKAIELQERCKILAEKIESRELLLAGLELVPKDPQAANLFIIRGNEKDDKQKLLSYIDLLAKSPGVPKECFDLSVQQADDEPTLSNVIIAIAAKGNDLLQQQKHYAHEIAIQKEYKHFLAKQTVELKQFRDKLKSKKLSKKELAQIREDLFKLGSDLIQHLNQGQELKTAQKQRLMAELNTLDTKIAIPYCHPKLGPIVLKRGTGTIAAACAINYLTPVAITNLLAIGTAIPGAAIGGVGAGIAKGLQILGVPISNESVKKAFFRPLLPAMLLATPTVMTAHKLGLVSYHFKYDDVPFIKAEPKSLPPAKETVTSFFGNEVTKSDNDIIPEWYTNLYKYYAGFDLSTEVKYPKAGKYEITYKNFIDFMEESEVREIIIWVDLLVEKRLHPEVRPRIERIKKDLALLEFLSNSCVEQDLKQFSESLAAEKSALDSVQSNKLQAALLEIVENRLLRQKKSFENLQGQRLACRARLAEVHRALLQQHYRYSLLQRLLEMLNLDNSFVAGFLQDYSSYIKAESTKLLNLNVVWGEKKLPKQQPKYVPHKPKDLGTALGAFFKLADKPGQSWLGKLSYETLLPTKIPSLEGESRPRRDTSAESILEKIAADLYLYLSEGDYLVPKTRLAELPILNEFTKDNDLAQHLYKKIKQSGRTPTEECVYVMSKRFPYYRDLFELTHCILDNEEISFLDCLKKGKLPETAKLEGKIVPIKGLMEVLAIARLLADTDVLGGTAKNAGFVIERDEKGLPIAARVVKVDPGFAFSFRSNCNLFYQCLNPAAPVTNSLKEDPKNLQYANWSPALPWANLSLAQQHQFIMALSSGLKKLRQSNQVKEFFSREAFKQTPKQRELHELNEQAETLEEYLNQQIKVYQKELNNLGDCQSNTDVPLTQQKFGSEAEKASALLMVHSSLFGQKQQNNAQVNLESIGPSAQTIAALSSVGLNYQEVPGEGHCLYQAVVFYLKQGEDQAWLRRIVTTHIEANLKEFAAFIQPPAGKTITDYINDIRNGKEWADHIEIEVLMRTLDRPIVIIGPDGKIRNHDDELLQRFKGEPIFVYYNGHNHYDALLHSNTTATAQQIMMNLVPPNQRSLQM